jgi:GntR family transcriptional repressor for pyruvate dehydrogenase complex
MAKQVTIPNRTAAPIVPTSAATRARATRAPDSAFLSPVPRTTLTADVSRTLVSHLMRGQWREGEKIPPERDLCLKLGVGRASLREALKALEIMGLIETRVGDGTYVCSRSQFFAKPLLWVIAGGSEAQTRELVEARTLIEVELAGLAAERATPSAIEQLGLELDRMAGKLNDPEGFVQTDVNFHLLIGTAAANSILMNALHLIRNLLQQWVLTAAATRGVPEKAYAQHKRILRAIKEHDSRAARKAMQKHLRAMAGFLPKPT